MAYAEYITAGNETRTIRDLNGQQMLATVQASTTASKAYAVGDYLILNDKVYKVTVAIASGGTITVGTNVTETKVGTELSNLNRQISESITPAIEEIETALDGKAPVIINTASGDIASFDDGADDQPIRSLVAKIEPVQDLHGYDYPWPEGGGKNLLDPRLPSTTQDGITITNNGDGSFNFVGTATANTNFRIDQISGGSTSNLRSYTAPFVMSMHSTATVGTLYLGGYKGETWTTPSCPVNSNTKVTDNIDNAFAYIRFNNGDTVNATFYPQIESGSTATVWSPYSNICPISGWDNVEILNDPEYGGAIEWNQIFQAPLASTFAGLETTRSNRNQTYTLNGTYGGTATWYRKCEDMPKSITGHVYFLDKGADNAGFELYNDGGGLSTELSNRYAIGRATKNNNFYYRIPVTGIAFDHLALNPMCVDLTRVFGAGNEPSTVEEFKALFPHEYYQYNEGEKTFVSSVNSDPYDSYTIQLGQTVYGGTLDVTNGVLTVDRRIRSDLNTLSSRQYTAWGSTHTYAVQLLDSDATLNDSRVIMNALAGNTQANIFGGQEIGFYLRDDVKELYISLPGIENDVEAFQTAIAGYQIVYPIAEVTYQLTPQELDTLLGTNNVWADVGAVDVEYPADTKLYIDGKIAEAIANALNA